MPKRVQRLPPTNLHRLLNLLPTAQADEFRRWAQYRTIAEVHKRVQEIYADVDPKPEYACPSIWSCENWLRQTYPPGSQAQSAVESVQGYHGIHEQALSFAELAIATTAANLIRVQKQIDAIQDNTDARLGSLIYASHNLSKELRTAAIALHEAKRLEDARTMYLAGCYRLASVLESAEPENSLNQMQHKLRASLAQIEVEARG